MAPASERWVLCGGASDVGAPQDALRLGTGEGPWHQVRVNIAGLEDSLTGKLDARWRDLIRLASMVLAADCGTSRGTLLKVDNGKSWRRSFRFRVAVQDPDFWSQPRVRRALQQTVGFLSDDHYRFEFEGGTNLEDQGPLFLPSSNGRTFVPWDHVDEVSLFSGGMDSFAGAAEATLIHKRNTLLVTRRSSTKMLKVQRDLVQDLRRLTGSSNPWHVELKVEMKGAGRVFEQDTHQRSRSFLFASIAGAVASMVGLDRIRFYENGIIAVNAPLSRQLVGAQATRTVHPRVVQGFAEILSMIADRPFPVENPYQSLTRAEVAQRIRDAGAKDLLRFTRSCASVRAATTQHPSCGVCSQCVDRQFAVRAAGMEADDSEDAYEVNLFRDALDDKHVLLPLAYVETGRRVQALDSPEAFLGYYPDVATALPGLKDMWECGEDEALRRLWELHRRQSSAVVSVMEAELARRARDVLGGGVHPHSLLGRCLERGSEAARRVHGVVEANEPATRDVEGPDSGTEEVPDAVEAEAVLQRPTFKRVGGMWRMGLPGSPPVYDTHRRGYLLISELLRASPRAIPSVVLDGVGRSTGKTKAPAASVDANHGADAAGREAQSVDQALDNQAIQQFRAQLQDLEEEIAEAEEMADLASLERLKRDREFILNDLAANTGLGGRSRDVNPDRERARDNVRKNITRALGKLKAQDPDLAVHLQRFIDCGTHNRYEPNEKLDWDL